MDEHQDVWNEKVAAKIIKMWSIIEGHLIQNRIHVKLIGESLGY
jgi:hypothetical protein